MTHSARSVHWMSETGTFEEILEKDGVLVYTCKGYSMWPLLRQYTDVLVIHKPGRELKKYDIVLFKSGNKYLLHRIVDIDETGIVTAGDHNSFKDSRIRKESVLGILTTIVRDGKEIDIDDPKLRAYGHLVADLFPLKAAVLKTRAFAGKVKRKIIG